MELSVSMISNLKLQLGLKI